ncbi:MAG TPA: phosphotransferase [Streptosporangiaceae bacterium]|nr:phosphotransferase [Streptosporangiaceae bacterium]
MMDEDAAVGEPEWAAEYPVGRTQAAELIGAQFPSLRGAQVEPLASGWDNTIFLVAGHWVFRFPRRAVAVPGLRREIAVLPRLAPWLPLPVPVPEFAGAPSAGYPWPFWGARLLPGHELAESHLPDAARKPAAAGVGRFLRALHDPGVAAAVGPSLQVDPLRRGDACLRAGLARERLDALARRGIWAHRGPADRLLTEAEQLTGSGFGSGEPPAVSPVVVHGDLHVRHLLVGDDGQAAGVIDFGDLCLADPAVDLSLAFGGFAGPARAALLAVYGQVSPQQEIRARVLAIFLCAALADYAAAQGRAQLLRETLAGIGRATALGPS